MARRRLLTAAHDCSGGGLAQTVIESCLRGGQGASLQPPGDPFVFLFSESAGRVVLSVPPANLTEVQETAAAQDIPANLIGNTGSRQLTITGVGTIELDDLRAAHERTLPALFG